MKSLRISLIVSCLAIVIAVAGFFNPAYAVDGSGSATISPSSVLVSSTGNTVRMVYTSTESMDGGAISFTAPAGWSTPQGSSGTAGYTTATTSGTIGNVFDTADQLGSWTSSGACSGGLSLDTNIAGGEVRAGTGSIKCVNTNADGPPNGVWYNTFASPQDWSSYTTVGFSIYSNIDISNSNLKFDYSANSSLTTSNASIESLNLGTVNLTGGQWKYISFNLSNSVTKNAVRSYGFRIANASVKGSTIIVDNFVIGASNITLTPTFSGSTATVNAITLPNGGTVSFTYGSGGGTSGATATATPGTSTFDIKTKISDNGTMTSISPAKTISVLDTTAPSVSLTAPTTGSTVHGSAVSLTATASDNVAVAGVTYYLDSVRLTSEISSPYSTTFDSTAKSDGNYTLVAVARDTSSNYATSTSATITIDNTGPVLSSIASSTTSTTATVTWTTNESSNSKVSYGTSSGTYTTSSSTATLSTSHSISITGLTDSTLYYYVVVSTDASGNTSTSTEKSFRTTDITAPSATLTSPTNGAPLSGSVSLSANASDNVAVAGVSFYIDGSLIGSEDTTAPYTGTLDSSSVADGSHSIVAVARDTSNNYATSTAASVTVSNPGPQLTTVSIASNNSSTTLAKVGDTVTLTIGSNQSLLAAIVSIAGHSVTVSTTTSTSFTATYTLTSGDSEGAVSFSIAPKNMSSKAGFTTSTTTDSTSVTLDKTAPSNEDTVLSSGSTVQGGATITVVSSGNQYNTIWLAPAGTTNFSAGTTKTTAGGTATSIAAPSAEGTYYLYVLDAAGNASPASTAAIVVDTTAPTLTSVGIASNNSNTALAKTGDTVTLTFISNENIGTPTVTIGAESGGSVTVTQGSDAKHWTARAALTSSDTNGTVGFSINFNDVAGNHGTTVSTVTDASSVTFDKTAPTLSSVSIASNNSSTTLAKSGDTITLSFTASESISSPTVTFRSGGNAVNIAPVISNPSGNQWTATYIVSSSDSEGTVTYSISGYHDAAGNNGSTVTTGTGRVSVDLTRPTVTLTSGESNPTGSSPFSVTATFSESVTGFDATDITVGNGVAGNVSGSGTTYTFDVTPMSNGLVTVDVGAGSAADAAGNTNTAASRYSITFSSARPTVMLSTTASSPTKTTPFHITATFSADVTGFTSSDLSGQVTNGTVSNFAGSASTYTFDVTPTADGAVTVTVPANAAVDAATGRNQNFASSPLLITYDATAPTLAEVTAVATPANTAAPSYVFNTTEAGTTTYGGGCTSSTGSAVSGHNTISFNSLSDGSYSCTITVTDAAGNVSSTLHVTAFTIDTTAPTVSALAASPTSSGATITWTTDEAASSQVLYGLTSSYGSSTAETNTSPRLTSHSVTLTGLVSCATYHFNASSTDAAHNSGYDGDSTFTTSGCAGNASVKSQSAHSVSHASGGTASLVSNGNGVSLTIPSSFGSNDAQFQIKQLDQTPAIAALGTPADVHAASNSVFDLHALTDVQTAQSVFNAPLTITLYYTPSDISGLDENTLEIYRNDDGIWTELSNCSVDHRSKSVTCDTDHFSTFAIFGKPAAVVATPPVVVVNDNQSSTSSSGGFYYSCRDPKATNYEPVGKNKASLCKYAQLFRRGLELGMSGDDVLSLQKLLVSKAFGPAAKALGAAGPHGYFGTLTRKALIEFQKANKISPSSGYFGPKTRAIMVR